MALIQTSSIEDQKVRTITFVGRLKSFRKGLTTLFESFYILNSLTDLPPYRLWIIGGDNEDVLNLKIIILQIPLLKKMFNEGKVDIWGHVGSEGLAELYSRSLLTVVPSYFEQFGLVAVEAMACGCPVLGSNTGGLKDSIIPCVTGKLFTPGDSQHLAAVLSGYIRNPRIAHFEGENAAFWAKEKFGLEPIYENLKKIIHGGIIHCNNISPKSEFNSYVCNSIISTIQNTLNKNIKIVGDFSGNSQISFCIKVQNHFFHVKKIYDRPSATTIYMKYPTILQCSSKQKCYIKKTKILSEGSFAPPIIKVIEESGIIISKWYNQQDKKNNLKLSEIIPTIKQLQCYGEKLLTNDIVNNYLNSLKYALENPIDDNIQHFHLVSASIQSLLEGSQPSYVDSHPQIELLCLRKVIENNHFPLPQSIKVQILLTSELILNIFPCIISKPILAHGDMKPEHFLHTTDGYKLCDWETAGFRTGAYDIASWLFKNEIGKNVGSILEALNLTKKFLPEKNEQILLLCWLQSFTIHDFLTHYLRGREIDLKKHQLILSSIPEATSYIYNE